MVRFTSHGTGMRRWMLLSKASSATKSHQVCPNSTTSLSKGILTIPMVMICYMWTLYCMAVLLRGCRIPVIPIVKLFKRSRTMAPIQLACFQTNALNMAKSSVLITVASQRARRNSTRPYACAQRPFAEVAI